MSESLESSLEIILVVGKDFSDLVNLDLHLVDDNERMWDRLLAGDEKLLEELKAYIETKWARRIKLQAKTLRVLGLRKGNFRGKFLGFLERIMSGEVVALDEGYFVTDRKKRIVTEVAEMDLLLGEKEMESED
jgi:hypothetical protein